MRFSNMSAPSGFSICHLNFLYLFPTKKNQFLEAAFDI